jgi:signal transduction histidine kinase
LLFFIPVIAYDVLTDRYRYAASLLIIPLLFHHSRFTPIGLLMIAAFTALAGLMKYRSLSSEHIRHEYIGLRDRAAEFSIQLEERNRELLERQDYEVKLATLQERNRIAREIHDNVGHLLSSSILQTGALLASCRDESLQESLGALNSTLSAGMNSIRESIHDLHDDSLDLENEMTNLAAGFKFCPVSLDYDITANPGKEIRYAFISIVKESLANIIKHSNAGDVRITLREHPGFYQLVISDNGTAQPPKQEKGIGLKNIMSRVNSLGGNINISSNNGFTLFISVPRER